MLVSYQNSFTFLPYKQNVWTTWGQQYSQLKDYISQPPLGGCSQGTNFRPKTCKRKSYINYLKKKKMCSSNTHPCPACSKWRLEGQHDGWSSSKHFGPWSKLQNESHMLNVRQEPGSLKTPWNTENEKLTLSPVFLLYFHTTTIFTTLLMPEVWVFLPYQARRWHHLRILQFNSILTLSTWRQHQVSRVKGSCPPDCPNHTSDSTCKLGLLPVFLTDQL